LPNATGAELKLLMMLTAVVSFSSIPSVYDLWGDLIDDR
jgi:hypothetical protein